MDIHGCRTFGKDEGAEGEVGIYSLDGIRSPVIFHKIMSLKGIECLIPKGAPGGLVRASGGFWPCHIPNPLSFAKERLEIRGCHQHNKIRTRSECIEV